MKQNIVYMITFMSLVFVSHVPLHGYRYTFSNHTEHTLLVGIKLCCAFEELTIKTVKPNKMITFVHGKDFPNVKFGYCLQSISYVKNPTLKNKIKPETAPWREINTSWIKSETYNDILDFAESLGYTAESTGKLITTMVIASSTGGASIPATMASAQGASTLKDLIASTPETENPQEENPPAKAAPSATENTSLGLAGFARGLAKLVSVTTCRDRHWDIYEDENGKIMFTSKIQQ